MSTIPSRDTKTTPVNPYAALLAPKMYSFGKLPDSWSDEMVIRDWLAATETQQALYLLLAHRPDDFVTTVQIVGSVPGIHSDTALSGVFGSAVRRWWSQFGTRSTLFESHTVRGSRRGAENFAKYRMSTAVAKRILLLHTVSTMV